MREALRCGRHRCSRRASLALRQRGVILKWRLRRLCMRRVAASDSRCTRCRPFPPRRPLRKPFGDYSPAPCVPYDVGTRGRRPANDTPRKTRTCSRWRLGHESHTQNTQRSLQRCSRFSWAGGAVRGAIGDALGCQAAQRQIMENLSDAPNPQEVISHWELGGTWLTTGWATPTGSVPGRQVLRIQPPLQGPARTLPCLTGAAPELQDPRQTAVR